MNGGIYEIVNKKNGNKYVGSSIDVKRRWRAHKSEFKRGVHFNGHLQNAWNKYGEKSFMFKVLVYTNPKESLRLENLLLDTRNYEYNIATDAVASFLGMTHSKETKKKMSLAHTGQGNPMYGMSGKLNPMWGRHRSEEVKQKLSRANSGREVSKEIREKLRKTSSGRTHSEDTKRKISIANTGENNYAWIDISKKDIEKMKLLKEQGKSYEKISQDFGVSSETVRRRVLGISRSKYKE